jgi:transposase
MDTPEKPRKQNPKRDKRSSVWPMKNDIGRPTECTEEVIKKVEVLIRNGNYIETAVACCGISKQTFYDWCKRAKKGEQPFRSFLDAVNRASAEAEAYDLAIIGKAANEGAWQAAAWKLERRNNDRWGRKNEVSLQGVKGGAPIKVADARKNLKKLSDAELDQLEALHLKMLDEDGSDDEDEVEPE